jgi:hypothetical protein
MSDQILGTWWWSIPGHLHIYDAHLQFIHVIAQFKNVTRPMNIYVDRHPEVFVESYGGRRMEHNIDVVDQHLTVAQVQAETGNAAIAGYGDHFVTEFRYRFANDVEQLWKKSVLTLEIHQFHAEPYRILEQLIDACVHILPLLGSHQQVNALQTRTRSQQLLNHALAHEPSTAGDENRRFAVKLLDRCFGLLDHDRLGHHLHLGRLSRWRCVRIRLILKHCPHLILLGRYRLFELLQIL